MNTTRLLAYRFLNPRAQLALFALAMLLQRMPVIKILLRLDKALSAPLAQAVRAASFVAGALGGFQAWSGATTFSTNPTLPAAATTGEEFDLAFTITGTPTAIRSWRISGALPDGLTLAGQSGDILNSGVGSISGTPTEVGSFALSVKPFNQLNATGNTTSAFTIDIVVAQGAPQESLNVSRSLPLIASSGEDVDFTFQIDDLTVGSWRILGDLPDGLSVVGNLGETVSGGVLNAASGRIVGALTEFGAFQLTVEAFGEADLGGTSSGIVHDIDFDISEGANPSLTLEPVSMTVQPGGRAQFFARGAGTNIAIQWKKDGVDIIGETGESLVIDQTEAGDLGSYTVEVSSPLGSVVSSPPAVLSTNADASARFVNISTRASVRTADGVAIAGFVLSGSESKEVLFRMAGPSLEELGLDSFLENPTMQLFVGGQGQDFNDNWGNATAQIEVAAAFDSVGAFPFDDGSSDSAMLLDLAQGGYTVIGKGVENATGIALIELYETDTTLEQPSRLVNISTRGFVGTGADVMIAGFVIQGTAAQTVLVRLSGPALVDQGVNGALEDPVLEMFSGANSIYTNDDWEVGQDGAEVASVTASVGGFALDSGSKDAAAVLTLQPGPYTCIGKGVGGGEGIALVEVYKVD